MGINDRDYVRRAGSGFFGSLAERGRICKWIIGANVVVFFIQLLTGAHGQSPFTDALELNVDRAVFHGEAWRLLTYAFLHDPGDIFHILFNMLLLYFFGRDMEDLYGPREFLIFYLVSALVGGAAFAAAHLIGFPANLCIGASGAVTAVLVLFAFHYPTRIIYFMFFLPVPIWLFIILEVGYDAYTLLANQRSMVAVAVHLGGAAFGFLYYRFNWRISPVLRRLWPDFQMWRRRARSRLRVYREEPPPRGEATVAAPAGVTSSVEEDRIKAQMDAVLEKISRVGRDNLTTDELDVLRRASEILRRRRN